MVQRKQRISKKCSLSYVKNLTAHSKLSQDAILVHNKALFNYLEQDDKNTHSEKKMILRKF